MTAKIDVYDDFRKQLKKKAVELDISMFELTRKLSQEQIIEHIDLDRERIKRGNKRRDFEIDFKI